MEPKKTKNKKTCKTHTKKKKHATLAGDEGHFATVLGGSGVAWCSNRIRHSAHHGKQAHSIKNTLS